MFGKVSFDDDKNNTLIKEFNGYEEEKASNFMKSKFYNIMHSWLKRAKFIILGTSG